MGQLLIKSPAASAADPDFIGINYRTPEQRGGGLKCEHADGKAVKTERRLKKKAVEDCIFLNGFNLCINNGAQGAPTLFYFERRFRIYNRDGVILQVQIGIRLYNKPLVFILCKLKAR